MHPNIAALLHRRLLLAALAALLIIWALTARCGSVGGAESACEGEASRVASGALTRPLSPQGARPMLSADGRVTVPRAETLPRDPFRRVATKALRGDYGPLVGWKRDAYVWGLARDVSVCGVAKVTSYGYLWEPGEIAGGTTMASGHRVYVGAVAANPEIPFGTIIWTAAYGLARVEDRGGWVKVGHAWVRGEWRRVTNGRETANLDYYSERPLPTLRNCPWARVKR